MDSPGTALLLLLAAGLGTGRQDFVEEKVVDRIPVFTTPSLRKLVNEGDTIRLPCFVDKLEGFVLLWRKKDTILSVADKAFNFQDTRATIVEEKEGNWLEIERARLGDEGDYTCHISVIHHQEISHSVRIRTRPKVAAESGLVYGDEGGNASMACSILEGEPTPEVLWSRHGGDDWPRYSPAGEGPTTTLVNLTRHDAGLYVCAADNGFTLIARAETRLRVRHRPYIEPSQDFVHSSPGESIQLTCTIHAFPPATVVWYRGVLPLSSLQYNISSDEPSYRLSLGPEQALVGNYSCTANNSYGVATKDIQLSNKVGPINILSVPVQNSSSSYTLRWEATSASVVKLFKVEVTRTDGRPVLEGESVPSNHSGIIWKGEFRMDGLDSASLYLARVSGTNEFGAGPLSASFLLGTAGARLPDSESLISPAAALRTCVSYKILQAYIILVHYSYTAWS